MPLTVLSHPVGKIAQPPIFSLLDLAGVVREELGERVCEGIDLRAGNVLTCDKYVLIERHAAENLVAVHEPTRTESEPTARS